MLSCSVLSYVYSLFLPKSQSLAIVEKPSAEKLAEWQRGFFSLSFLCQERIFTLSYDSHVTFISTALQQETPDVGTKVCLLD